jgi:hypothetical protein
LQDVPAVDAAQSARHQPHFAFPDYHSLLRFLDCHLGALWHWQYDEPPAMLYLWRKVDFVFYRKATMSENPQHDINEGLLASLAALHARIDTLNYVVLELAVRAGADRKKLQAGMKTYRQTCYQKYLEQFESLSPSVAARIDSRSPEDMQFVDQKILDALRPESGSEP